MTTPTAKRERARRIREVALSFNDDFSQTVRELAEGLEVEASIQEAAEADRAQQRQQPTA